MVSEVDRFEPWVVLLAGGVGSRFWPASTPARPKQFLPLASDQPLIQDTLDRAGTVAPEPRILIVTAERLLPLFEQYLPAFPRDRLLVEPQPKGTAPALALAATELIRRASHPERAVMVAMPSDHVIRPADSFRTTLQHAIEAAGSLNRLLTLGVRPTRPETAYGYIEVGAAAGQRVHEVKRFVEKPDSETAEGYMARGGFLWNSGIFIWKPQVLLQELKAHTPELADHLNLLNQEDAKAFFARLEGNLTIDYGLMERTGNIAVVEADFEWDDVGSWAALLRLRDSDDDGNVLVGDGIAVDSSDTIVWAEDGPVVVWDSKGMIVARASGLTFVAPAARAAELKKLLDQLPDRLRHGDG